MSSQLAIVLQAVARISTFARLEASVNVCWWTLGKIDFHIKMAQVISFSWASHLLWAISVCSITANVRKGQSMSFIFFLRSSPYWTVASSHRMFSSKSVTFLSCAHTRSWSPYNWPNWQCSHQQRWVIKIYIWTASESSVSMFMRKHI